MSDIRKARRALAARVLDGDGAAAHTERRAAFDNVGLPEPASTLLDKVVRHAGTVSDEDVIAAKTSGLSEDQIFELVICAAIGQATRQHDVAVAVLDTASGKS
jgi:alkylhydroperoxidase family enzyme